MKNQYLHYLNCVIRAAITRGDEKAERAAVRARKDLIKSIVRAAIAKAEGGTL